MTDRRGNNGDDERNNIPSPKRPDNDVKVKQQQKKDPNEKVGKIQKIDKFIWFLKLCRDSKFLLVLFYGIQDWTIYKK